MSAPPGRRSGPRPESGAAETRFAATVVNSIADTADSRRDLLDNVAAVAMSTVALALHQLGREVFFHGLPRRTAVHLVEQVRAAGHSAVDDAVNAFLLELRADVYGFTVPTARRGVAS